MSTMGDGTVKEVATLTEYILKLLLGIIKLLTEIESHHQERVIKGKSVTGKIAAGAVLAAKELKRKLMSGKVNVKQFDKLRGQMAFNNITLPKSMLPEIEKSCKKAGIPIYTAEGEGNICVAAIPEMHNAEVNEMLKKMVSKAANRDGGMSINQNAEFKGIDNEVLHNVLNSYDIPSVSFKKNDGSEIIAVPTEYQEQYLDAVAEARETVRDVSNIEITDLSTEGIGYVWDDPNTSVIEVTPLQARLLDEYNSKVKIVDIDGKLYAHGPKNAEQEVNELIEADKAVEMRADEWKIGVIDNSITLNKKALLGREEETSQLIKIPGEDNFIRFSKDELSEMDEGKTLATKLDFERDYEICDADGNLVNTRNGNELASIFNTRSPFNKLINDSTDKTKYSNSIDRIELYNEKTNKLELVDKYVREHFDNARVNMDRTDEQKKLEYAESFIDNVLCVNIEYLKFIPDRNEISWIYFNPEGCEGKGQFVENRIDKELITDILTRENVDREYFSDAIQSECIQYCTDAIDDLFQYCAEEYTKVMDMNEDGQINSDSDVFVFDTTDVSTLNAPYEYISKKFGVELPFLNQNIMEEKTMENQNANQTQETQTKSFYTKPYAEIENKKFIECDAKTAYDISQKAQAAGVEFSAKFDGENSSVCLDGEKNKAFVGEVKKEFKVHISGEPTYFNRSALINMENREYINTDSKTAYEIGQKAQAAGVEFSAKFDGENSYVAIDGIKNKDFADAVKIEYADKLKEYEAKANEPTYFNRSAYNNIQNKAYLNTDSKTAYEIGQKAQAAGVEFSAKFDGDKSTVTVDGKKDKAFVDEIKKEFNITDKFDEAGNIADKITDAIDNDALGLDKDSKGQER